jgi:hypothetical protein
MRNPSAQASVGFNTDVHMRTALAAVLGGTVGALVCLIVVHSRSPSPTFEAAAPPADSDGDGSQAFARLNLELLRLESRVEALERSSSAYRLGMSTATDGVAPSRTAIGELDDVRLSTMVAEAVIAQLGNERRAKAKAEIRQFTLPQPGSIYYVFVDDYEAMLLSFYDQVWDIRQRELDAPPTQSVNVDAEYQQAYRSALDALTALLGGDAVTAQRALLAVCVPEVRSRLTL